MNLFFYPDDSEILATWNWNSSFKYFCVIRIEKQICWLIFWRSYSLTILPRDLLTFKNNFRMFTKYLSNQISLTKKFVAILDSFFFFRESIWWSLQKWITRNFSVPYMLKMKAHNSLFCHFQLDSLISSIPSKLGTF